MEENCCNSYQNLFNDKWSRKDLRNYLRKGMRPMTSKLVDALKLRDLSGLSLIDIGGGIGVISFELFEEGIASSNHVDISESSTSVCREESGRRRLSEKMNIINGDFLDHESDLPESDIVTLDKVICCYEDYERLVLHSSRKCLKYYGYVLPRDTWWVKLIHGVSNPIFILTKKFRSYIHPNQAVENLLASEGFQQIFEDFHWQWKICLFEKN